MDYLRNENEKLKKDVTYLNRKCEELMQGSNDDAMIALLKNKINSLENSLEETEKKYEHQIHHLKQKYNDLQRESNGLRVQMREIESQLDSKVQELSISLERQKDKSAAESKIDELRRQIAEKDETLIKLASENITLDSRFQDLRQNMNSFHNAADPRIGETEYLRESQDQSQNVSNDANDENNSDYPRKIIRKRRISQISRPGSREERKGVSIGLIGNLQGDETLKKMLIETIDEKGRLEKINMELSNKILSVQKAFQSEKDEFIQKENKRHEHLNLKLKQELEETRRQREENEKKLLTKIISLEKKLEEREEEMRILGNGIESLRKDLQIRDDPSHNSVQLLKYLERFAKYQNDFLKQEVSRFQGDFTKLKLDVKEKESEYQACRNSNAEQKAIIEKLTNDLDLHKELLAIKSEEVISSKQENNNLVIAMELLRKEKVQISNLKKANNEMVNSS